MPRAHGGTDAGKGLAQVAGGGKEVEQAIPIFGKIVDKRIEKIIGVVG